ncbi:MAG TPA: DUF5677 domain-containing protein [Verrucomicrobiae bacterium]|nr:DUF5677 domain-containing protein [Verrucomicrobiae bacterium]
MKRITPQLAASIEAESFQLLRDLQDSLAGVLKSLDGKRGANLFECFLFHTSAYVNRTAEGFVALRQTGRIDASKLLVRPAMEAMFKQQAVLRQPELLYRMAYTERLEDRKLIEPVYHRAGKNYDNLDCRQWEQFKKEYAKQYPNHTKAETKLSLYDAAKAAKIERYYESYYRLYCQTTHAAFRAATGGLKFTDVEDNRTMALCVLGALDALERSRISNVPGLSDFRQRLSNLPG